MDHTKRRAFLGVLAAGGGLAAGHALAAGDDGHAAGADVAPASDYLRTIPRKPGEVQPFTASLGIPLCSAATPAREGTGTFFFLDPANPGALFLLTARHILFDPAQDDNAHYEFREDTGEPRREVLLMSAAGFAARCQAIRVEIEEKRDQMRSIESRRAWASSRRTNDEEEPDAAAAGTPLDWELRLAQEAIE